MERIIVNNVTKKFKIGFHKNKGALERLLSAFSGREAQKTIFALRNVSFTACSGEFIGMIGENTSGKSTLLRIIAGVYKADGGEVTTHGKTISLINLFIGLKERLTMSDNIYLCAHFFGLNNRTIRSRFDSMVDFAGLQEFVDTKTYQFSNGMKQRLAFSIAIHCEPDIILLDEDFEVGDEEFKRRCSSRIASMVQNGATAVLISHDLGLVKKYCPRAIWLHEGGIRHDGDADKAISSYLESLR